MESRREFEDRLAGALERARRDESIVAVIVGELMGLLVINSRFGFDAGAHAIEEAKRRLETAVHGYADFVARIGEAEFAVLLAGVTDRNDAERVKDRIAAAFAEPMLIEGEPIQTAMAMAVNIGPGRRRTDEDLLWRTAEESSHSRSAVLQRMLSEVRGDASSLDEVAQTFADQGLALFALDACEFVVGERSWHAPPVLPDAPPVHELPLRAEGRPIGSFRWWGPLPDETDMSGVQILLDHVAAALDRAALVDATESRARTDPLTGLLNREGLAREMDEVVEPFALAMIDLDHFKRVNDEHGHDVGDLVLRDLSALLRRGRTGDLVARWGGEEIVLVMPATTVRPRGRRRADHVLRRRDGERRRRAVRRRGATGGRGDVPSQKRRTRSSRGRLSATR
jgi:diguanylate cyclase (GGDEF)-like protein